MQLNDLWKCPPKRFYVHAPNKCLFVAIFSNLIIFEINILNVSVIGKELCNWLQHFETLLLVIIMFIYIQFLTEYIYY